jgi:lysophospholipase L1-like esterase
VIEDTYAEAKAGGDEHVYYVDNLQLTALCGDEGTVDGTHPNDYGYTLWARSIEKPLLKILKKYGIK